MVALRIYGVSRILESLMVITCVTREHFRLESVFVKAGRQATARMTCLLAKGITFEACLVCSELWQLRYPIFVDLLRPLPNALGFPAVQGQQTW